jgi:N-acetyltransferase
MMYTRSSEEDQVAHSAYHRKFELGVRFTGWKQERIVRLFGESEHGERVIQVRADDRAAHLQKFGQLKEVMDAEMGFVANAGGSGGSSHGASPLREAAGELAYISISATGTAVACAIVQRISVGFPVASHADAAAAGDTSPGMDAPEASDSLVCSTSPQPCSMGVKQMWVHRSHRRKGHMTRLLDVIRANYTPGRMVAKTELAFTQTTPDGKQFAIDYCETKHYKIYEASW